MLRKLGLLCGGAPIGVAMVIGATALPAEAAVQVRAAANASAIYGIGIATHDYDDSGWSGSAVTASAQAERYAYGADTSGESEFSADFGVLKGRGSSWVNNNAQGVGGVGNHTGRGGGDIGGEVYNNWTGAIFEDEITVTASGVIDFTISLHSIIDEPGVDDGGGQAARLYFYYQEMGFDDLSDPSFEAHSLFHVTAGELTSSHTLSTLAPAGVVLRIRAELAVWSQTSIDPDRPEGEYEGSVDAMSTGRLVIGAREGGAFSAASGAAYVPEPTTVACLAISALGLATRRRR